MDWTTIINYLMGGGGLLALLTIPSSVKHARSQAAASVEERWKNYATEIHNDLSKVNEKCDKLEAQNRIQFQVIMTAFGCKLRTDANECPVVVSFKDLDNGK